MFGSNGYTNTIYTYTPYGEVTASSTVAQSPRGLGGGLDKPEGFAPQGRAADGAAVSQPLQWSSEYHDTELSLVYYNYRHYNPIDGRWIRRDGIGEMGEINNYRYAANRPTAITDNLGQDYTVNVDKETCTITFSLVIVLAFNDDVPKEDRPHVQQQIEDTIESEWSGRKKGCCTVNVDVEIREPSIWNHIEDWFTPDGRENNYVDVTYNQTGGYNGTNRSYVVGNQTGVFVTNSAEVNGSHNPRTDYATWAYAHEAGHLMGLEDGYYEANGEQGARSGYNGDEMMSAAYARVTQNDIDRLTNQTPCPCEEEETNN